MIILDFILSCSIFFQQKRFFSFFRRQVDFSILVEKRNFALFVVRLRGEILSEIIAVARIYNVNVNVSDKILQLCKALIILFRYCVVRFIFKPESSTRISLDIRIYLKRIRLNLFRSLKGHDQPRRFE